MKSQFKIALIFFTGTLCIILLLSISVYYFSTRFSFIDFYKRLEVRAVLAAKSQLESEEGKASAFREMRDQHLEKLPGEKDYFFKIDSLLLLKNMNTQLGVPMSFFDDIITLGNSNYKNGDVFYSGIKYKGVQGNYIVVVSATNDYDSQHLHHLRNIFIIAIPLASLLALVISLFFSKRIFKLIKKITDNVKEISSENMHLRLDKTPSDNDEMGELITTFNNMLDRLETSFETQNNFISNASHELSTPLTAIIGETEVTLSKDRTPKEYTEALHIVLNEAERLEQITKSLLFLAQTGFDGKKQKMEEIRSDELLWDTKKTIDKMNPGNQVQIDLGMIPENPEKLTISGNVQLLHLALANILSNACKYSSNKPVKVSIATTDHEVIIIVKDSGIGIPENELKYIYDPFFRASNTRNFEGYGIGLPLSRNIIRLHKGSLLVSSAANQGVTAQIRFPRIK